MIPTIDLNVDIGEGFAFDRELLKFATSANVCCGVHAGSKDLTAETVALCGEMGVQVGIHPGYPDRVSMGRAPMSPEHQFEYLSSVFEQVRGFLQLSAGSYVKPHGAFYNETAAVLPEAWELRAYTDRTRSSRPASLYESEGSFLAKLPGVQSLMMIMRIAKIPLLGLPHTAHEVIALRAGQKFIREGFGDRRYNADNTLVPRTEPGAILTELEEIKEQVHGLLLNVDSICLHGDNPDCLIYAEFVYKTITDAGYQVSRWR